MCSSLVKHFVLGFLPIWWEKLVSCSKNQICNFSSAYGVFFVTLQIWHCLAETAIYITDREACFKWFAKVSGIVHVA